VTTRARGSAGEWAGGLSAPGRRLRPRLLARGRCRARRPTPGGCPRFPRPVVARRYAGLRHRAKPISAGSPSNGADDSFTVQDHSQGCAFGASVLRTADP
jgi:hypothetical protein